MEIMAVYKIENSNLTACKFVILDIAGLYIHYKFIFHSQERNHGDV